MITYIPIFVGKLITARSIKMKLESNVTPVNGIKITEKRMDDGVSYGTEGRAILRISEAKSLVSTNQKTTNPPFIIYIPWESLTRMHVIRMARKFAIQCSPQIPYIKSKVPKEDAIELIKDIGQLHGFSKHANDEGILILTDKTSFHYSVWLQSTTVMKEGLTQAISNIKEYQEPVVLVDDPIVKRYYSNSKVTQIAVEEYGGGSEEEDNVSLATKERCLAQLQESYTQMLNISTKIAVTENGEEKDKLCDKLARVSDTMNYWIREVEELVTGEKGETELRLQSMQSKVENANQLKTFAQEEAEEIGKKIEQIQKSHQQAIYKLEKQIKAEKIEIEIENETKVQILSEQVSKLQMALDGNKIKTEPRRQYSTSSSEDGFMDETIAWKPSNNPPYKPFRPMIATAGTVDQDAKTKQSAKDQVFGTPQKFGMKTWVELECSFLEHLIRIEMGLSQAEEKGCTLKVRQNLILMTLPTGYEYVADFITATDRESMDLFKSRLIELICGTKSDQTSELLKAQRRSDENVLSYFRRLKSMYMYCTKKGEEDLATDAMGLNMFYQKILECLPSLAKIEFTRLCEEQMASGSFTFEKLKQYTVVAARKAPKAASMLTPVQSQNQRVYSSNNRFVPGTNVGPYNAERKSTGQDSNKGWTEVRTRRTNRRETRTCFFCKKEGHIYKNCYARKKQEPEIKVQREAATEKEGRQPSAYSH